MTVIVGIEWQDDDGRHVLLGGDSAGTAGLVRVHRADQKVYEVGSFVLGFTTSFRMGQLLRYATFPDPPNGDDLDALDRFMATTFVDAVRKALKDGGWAAKDRDREEGGTFLVAVRGRLYEIESDYQAGRTLDGYAAVGCGWELAMGALHATRALEPDKRLLVALEAAAHHSTGVHGPFTVVGQVHNVNRAEVPS